MYAHGFRFYFTPLSGVLFAFPSRYWFTIGRQVVFSLGGWSPHVQAGFHVPRPTHRRPSSNPFQIRGYHPLWPAFPCRSSKNSSLSTHWAGPRSLAATKGISVDFFSSGYLDVSVPRVRLLHLCIQCRMPLARRVSPFGHLRVKACCQLTEAYRRLPRPSSPPVAKASTVCA